MVKLTAIGFIGEMKVYIDLEKSEAIKRYNAENPDYQVEKNNLTVIEFMVEDSFYVYDIWDKFLDE